MDDSARGQAVLEPDVVGGTGELGGIVVSVALLFEEALAAWKEKRKERATRFTSSIQQS
jgi:hypothetical protein